MRRVLPIITLPALALAMTGCGSQPQSDAHAMGTSVDVSPAEGITLEVLVEDVTSGTVDDLRERGIEPLGGGSSDDRFWFVDYTVTVVEGDVQALQQNSAELGVQNPEWTAENDRGGEMSRMAGAQCRRDEDAPLGLSPEEPYPGCRVFVAPDSVELVSVEIPDTGVWDVRVD